jgi:hypothetical protein
LPDPDKLKAVMCPSTSFNHILNTAWVN